MHGNGLVLKIEERANSSTARREEGLRIKASALLLALIHEVPSPTVTLAILGSMTFRWSHVRVANIGHFRAILGPQKGVSALLNASTRPKCHCRTRR